MAGPIRLPPWRSARRAAKKSAVLGVIGALFILIGIEISTALVYEDWRYGRIGFGEARTLVGGAFLLFGAACIIGAVVHVVRGFRARDRDS